MSYELHGVIALIHPTQVVTDKFKKREFELNESGTDHNGNEWSKLYKIEVHQSMCETLDQYSVGDKIRIDFVILSKKDIKQDGKVNWWINFKANKVELVGQSRQPYAQPTPTPVAQVTQPLVAPPLTSDDIPF